MICRRILKIISTASVGLPERARPARHLPWPVRIMFTIWSLWRKCWDTKFPWSGLEMTGLLLTPQNPSLRGAGQVSGNPGESGASIGKSSAARHGRRQKKPGRVRFQAHFSALDPNLPNRLKPKPPQSLKNPPPKNDRSGKRSDLPGLPRSPSRTPRLNQLKIRPTRCSFHS